VQKQAVQSALPKGTIKGLWFFRQLFNRVKLWTVTPFG
jgi:hypothetical protein